MMIPGAKFHATKCAKQVSKLVLGSIFDFLKDDQTPVKLNNVCSRIVELKDDTQ